MESLKKLLKTDQFKEISNNNEILKEIRVNLINLIGDRQSKLGIRDNSLFITFSKNSFASKFKIIKKEILKELNLIQNKITFTDIYSKVDPSIIKTEMKLTSNKKLSKKAKIIWANLSEALEDSPLKDYFLNKID
jgi:hypothetical protein